MLKFKPTIAVLASLLILAGSASAAQAAESSQVTQFQPATVVAFSFPTIGSVRYGDSGYAKSFIGGNILLGFSYRSYTGVGLRPGRFNFYWGAGTIILLIPYWELGFTYAIEIAQGEQLLNIDIGLLYIIPYIGIGLLF